MKRWTVVLTVLSVAVLFSSCGPTAPGAKGTEIIEAEEALRLAADGAVLVDARTGLDYNKGHVAGAVNISRADIVVMQPFANMLAPPEQVEEALGSRGIGNDSLVVVYDDNQNMDSARLWWTLKAYGHDAVKVVSGGIKALEAAGGEITTERPSVAPAVFEAGPLREEMLATKSQVKKQVDEPEPDVVILDVRSLEEYNEGTIPGSVCLDFAGNNFRDGTYRPVQHIRIRYLEQGIDYDDRVIMYCKTSIRAAQTHLALYNAGYRDLQLYDGAWLEWSASPANPIQKPDPTVTAVSPVDNS